ncbi:response regulator transcription factor, partial [Actinomyces israelii]
TPRAPTTTPTPGALPPGVTLSPRELEVLALMAEALSNKQIARRLGVSQATVKTHVSALIAKLGVQDRVGAVVHALRNRLV